jgi:hypothetical protein
MRRSLQEYLVPAVNFRELILRGEREMKRIARPKNYREFQPFRYPTRSRNNVFSHCESMPNSGSLARFELSIQPLRLVLTDAFRGAGDARRNCFIC